jgi:hypothetical protein
MQAAAHFHVQKAAGSMATLAVPPPGDTRNASEHVSKESRSSPVRIPREGVNFASRPLIHFLIKILSCYSKKHAVRIKLEGIYTAEEPIFIFR